MIFHVISLGNSPNFCVLNVLELQKNLYFETAFSIVSAYAEHLITLVAVHQWQHVPIFQVSLETL